MKETLYLNGNVAIMNFDLAFPRTSNELLDSSTFKNFVEFFIESIKDTNVELYDWALQGNSVREAKVELTRVFRKLIVLELDEVNTVYLEDKERFIEFIEELYNFWKAQQRFSVISGGDSNSVQQASFMEVEHTFNAIIRATYRGIEEKVQGRKNSVYRQLQAGCNACIALRNNDLKLGKTYDALRGIKFVENLMLRTPLILQPRSNKRTGMFTEVYENQMKKFTGNADEWFCYPAKIGSLLAFIYLHRDFSASMVSLGNLFELANAEECENKPDLVLIFGNEDNEEATDFYYDAEESIWVGRVSYHERIDYFGYMKKMSLTLHNVAMMEKDWLPIHGAFINITLKNGKRKGIMLMGDSGAGKSESIEALKNVGADKIKKMDVIFDDMGTIHIEDGVPYGQGTEIGAFIRLDDLDKGTPYRDMDRSIFMNPDSNNARVITPAAPYELVAKNHTIDMFVYANNYDDKIGIRKIDDMNEAKAIYVEGKRMALGTTQEVGISTTYFANPFGPMQKQDICDPLIDTVFANLKDNGIFVGEIFTHLGFSKEERVGLEDAARELLAFIEND